MVTVYTKHGCGQCVFVKKWLESEDIAFDEVNVQEEEKGMDYIKDLGYASLPVVDYEDFHFNGFNEEKLEQLKELV